MQYSYFTIILRYFYFSWYIFIYLFYFQSDAALMYDAVYVFAVGLQTLEQSHSLQLTNLSCEEETPWDAGLSLINYVNSVSMINLPIEFRWKWWYKTCQTSIYPQYPHFRIEKESVFLTSSWWIFPLFVIFFFAKSYLFHFCLKFRNATYIYIVHF